MNTRRDDDESILDICLTFFCDAVWVFTWLLCLLPLFPIILFVFALARIVVGPLVGWRIGLGYDGSERICKVPLYLPWAACLYRVLSRYEFPAAPRIDPRRYRQTLNNCGNFWLQFQRTETNSPSSFSKPVVLFVTALNTTQSPVRPLKHQSWRATRKRWTEASRGHLIIGGTCCSWDREKWRRKIGSTVLVYR